MRTPPLLLLCAVAAVCIAPPCAAEGSPSDASPYVAPEQVTIGPDGFAMQAPESTIIERMRRQAQDAKARPAAPPRGFDSTPVKMAPLTSLDIPLTVAIRYELDEAPGPGGETTPLPMASDDLLRLDHDIYGVLKAEGLPVLDVYAERNGSGKITFRGRDLGSIHIDVFPGPSARGSVKAPAKELIGRMLGRRYPVWAGGSRVSVHLDDAFTLQGTALIPAKNIPSYIYPDKKAKVNFWSTAGVPIQGEGSPLEAMLKDTEVTLGPVEWDGEGLSIMGLSLSGNKLTYQPTASFELGRHLGLELKMKDKVVIKEFAPPPLKTPEGGLLVSAEYSSKGLKRTRDGGISPVGEEASSLFYNGAGVAEGQRIVTTAARYRTVLEAAFGRSGGGRELYAGKSWFCDGMFAGEGSAPERTQEVWYDRFETADGDMLLLRMNYLKVSVSLALSKEQILFEGGQSQFAHLLFYLCPSPAGS